MDKTLLYAGGAVAAYLLFIKPKTTTVPGTVLVPGSSLPVSSSSLIAINSGVKGGDGSFYKVSNYSQLVALNPNLSNPNYQLTPAESSQYLSNYLNLQQGLPGWVGQTYNGVRINSLAQAVQRHWTVYGVANQMVFVPMQPPSNANFVPAQPNVNSSGGGGSSWVGSALSTVGSVAVAALPYLMAIAGPNEPVLNDAECQILFTGSAILKDILPYYAQMNRQAVSIIQTGLDDLLTQYA